MGRNRDRSDPIFSRYVGVRNMFKMPKRQTSPSEELRIRVRREFAEITNSLPVVQALSGWISSCRQSLIRLDSIDGKKILLAIENSSLEELFAEMENLESRIDRRLLSSVNETLQGDSHEVAPLFLYALGRASMLDVLYSPQLTDGLTLPYLLFEELDRHGIARCGISDQLFDTDIEAFPNAIAEIEQYINKVKSTPESLIKDRRELLVYSNWKTAIGIEQVTSQELQDLIWDFPFRNVLMGLSQRNPILTAAWIDALEHPSLQLSTMIDEEILDLEVMLNLMRHFEQCFDAKGNWTGNQAARVLIHIYETRLLNSIAESNFYQQPEPQESSQLLLPIEAKLAEFKNAILSRDDGRRLLLEWLSHLFEQKILNESTTLNLKLNALDSLLNLLIDVLSKEDWINAREIWKLFGGRPQLTSEGLDYSYLPPWIDRQGKRNHLIPCCLASLFAESVEVNQPFLIHWITEIFRHITEEPDLLVLSTEPSGLLLGVLSKPIALSDKTTLIVNGLWTDISYARQQARFFRPRDGTGKIQQCNAVAELGLNTLFWLEMDQPKALTLLVVLQDIVDEFRYCIPFLGLRQWTRLVENLSAGAALTGCLKSNAILKQFLERYHGDDDALVAACSACVSNGIKPAKLAEQLSKIGVDIMLLKCRWEEWNGSRFGRNAPFFLSTSESLRMISDAGKVRKPLIADN